MVLCFLSAVKQLGSKPNLCNVSGRWRCQCHFLIIVAAGHASWNDLLAFSTAANKDLLVVVRHCTPPWHWSITFAIAKKALTACGHKPCGSMIVSKKCLTSGNNAKHSEAMQGNLVAFLAFSICFLKTINVAGFLSSFWVLSSTGCILLRSCRPGNSVLIW